MENYKITFTSNAMSGNGYIQHYGKKGMRWGVVHEEKPVGPTRGPVLPLQAQTAPKSKVASQPVVSGHRYQDLLKQMNSRSASTNRQPNAAQPSISGSYYQPVFNRSSQNNRPNMPYVPKDPVEAVPSAWELWSSAPGLDLNNVEDQKYGGFVAGNAGAFANFLKNEGISQISDITDPTLDAYDINHYQKELERIIIDSMNASPVAQRLGLMRYRKDLLLELKRQGFDFFPLEEKAMDRAIGFYPTQQEVLQYNRTRLENPQKADQIMRNQRVSGTQSRVGREEEGSQRSSSGRNPYGSSSRVVKKEEGSQRSSSGRGPYESSPAKQVSKEFLDWNYRQGKELKALDSKQKEVERKLKEVDRRLKELDDRLERNRYGRRR